VSEDLVSRNSGAIQADSRVTVSDENFMIYICDFLLV